MITAAPNEFLKATLPEIDTSATTMRQAMLIGPEGFGISRESASDNVYMDPSLKVDMERALDQHWSVIRTIESVGVPVKRFSGLTGLDDGMYPNNAFATAGKKLILGRMLHTVRQAETSRSDIVEWFTRDKSYQIIDLSRLNDPAELTGSLIIDHGRNTGFCGLSTRTVPAGARNMHKAFGLQRTLTFDLVPGEYHTNLVLTVLASRCCLVYLPAIASGSAAQALQNYFQEGCIEISQDEKNNFVANSLALTPTDIIMSQRAANALSDRTAKALESFGFKIHSVNIDELEKGGGSMRCLIMEVF